jgi:hypothetical protein
MKVWNRDTILLLTWILLGATWMVLHFALSLRVWRSHQLPVLLRWFGWLPPITPVAGLMCGAGGWAVLWCIVAIAYVVLRSFA